METEVIISTGAAKYVKKLKDKNLKEKFAEAIKKIKENLWNRRNEKIRFSRHIWLWYFLQ